MYWFLILFTCLQGKQNTHIEPYSFTVSHITGIAHMVLKERIRSSNPLHLSAVVEGSSVYSVVVGNDSYLELTKSEQDSDMVTPLIRLGSKTALEVRSDNTLFMFQGSALFCHKDTSIQLFPIRVNFKSMEKELGWLRRPQ